MKLDRSEPRGEIPLLATPSEFFTFLPRKNLCQRPLFAAHVKIHPIWRRVNRFTRCPIQPPELLCGKTGAPRNFVIPVSLCPCAAAVNPKFPFGSSSPSQKSNKQQHEIERPLNCIMPKLPDDLRVMIDKLCQKGDQFAQIDQLDDALDQYEAAWDLLPNPKNQWPAATWILMTAGDVYFERRDFVAASKALRDAIDFPDGDGNEFIWLRLGQSLFEIGDLNAAANALENAFRMSGEELFADEEPKYLDFLKTQLGVMRVKSAPPASRFNKPLQ